jgi:hypothetical protein
MSKLSSPNIRKYRFLLKGHEENLKNSIYFIKISDRNHTESKQEEEECHSI